MEPKQPSDADLVKTAVDALTKLKEIQNDPRWEQFAEEPCLMLKMTIESRVMSRGETNVKIPMKSLYDKLGEVTSLQHINPQLKEMKILHTCNVNGTEARVNYMKYAGIWPVEDRDMVSSSAREEGPNSCYIATQACDFPYPKQDKVTRATCNIGGWILKKVDEENTYVIYISDVDLAGSIPQMIKNQLAQRQASLPSKVEKALKCMK